MNCEICGSKTLVNYGDAYTTLCSKCAESEEGKSLARGKIAVEISKTQSQTTVENDVDSYHFKALLGYGKFISGLGWVTVILGVIGIFAGLGSGKAGIVVASAAFFGVLAGIGLVASGQLISCFVAIEKNTRTTYELLKQK